MKRYRLQYMSKVNCDIFAIVGDGDGNCWIRAIQEETDVVRHNEREGQNQPYSHLMTISQARDLIVKMGQGAVGSDMSQCLGLSLEDGNDLNRKVSFGTIVY
ncbi:hypothetical protein ACFL3M_00440 [Patescibacteria group bacterium]